MRFSSVLAISGALRLTLALSGQATFYGGNLHGGTCSFSTYTLPRGIYGTALSDSNWDSALHCGQCISVTYPGKDPIMAMIVDQCPGCGLNHLDLFPDAFSALATPSIGVIDVTWSYINCPITSPLQLHNKEGVSAYWFSMQVVNANKQVKSLEVSTNGGSTWQPTTRQSYNFFQYESGYGTTVVDVKVTSEDDDVVIVKSVPVSDGASVTASANFGSSPPAVTTTHPQAASTSSEVPSVSLSAASSATSSTTSSTTSSAAPSSTSSTTSSAAPSATSSAAPFVTPPAPTTGADTSSAIPTYARPTVPPAPLVCTLSTTATSSTTTIPPPSSFTTIPAIKTLTIYEDCTTSSEPPVSTTTVYIC